VKEYQQQQIYSSEPTNVNDQYVEITPKTTSGDTENQDGRKICGLQRRKKHLVDLQNRISSLEIKLRESRLREKATLKRLHREESRSHTRNVRP